MSSFCYVYTKALVIRIMIFSLLLLTSPLSSLLNQPVQPEVRLTFLSSVDFYRQQLQEAEKSFDSLKKRYETEQITRTRQENELLLELETLKKEVAQESLEEAEMLLHKRIAHINARRQNYTHILDTFKTMIDSAEKEIKLVKEIIEFLQSSKQEQKFVYSWKEFNEAQSRKSEFNSRIETAQDKRDELKRQSLAEKEIITYWQKQIEVKNKELEKISNTVQTYEKNNTDALSKNILKLEADAIKEDVLVHKEKIEGAQLSIEKLDLEIKLQESEIELLRCRKADHIQLLDHMSRHLSITSSDIESAKEAARLEAQKAQRDKDAINQLREQKKNERQRLITDIKTIREKRASFKALGQNRSAEGLLLKTTIKKQQLFLNIIEQELAIINARKELADSFVTLKELLFKAVDLRYKISKSEEIDVLDSLIANFSNQRSLSFTALKALKDSSTAVTRHNNQIFDELKTFENKLYSENEDRLKSNDNLLREIKRNLEQAHRYSKDHSNLVQQYLSITIEIMNNQEKIIAQYDYILAFLNAERETRSIWERSSKAISWPEFIKATNDAESFFRKVFWLIPSYLSPSSIIFSIKIIFVEHYLTLLLFLFLFFSLYWLTRGLLTYIDKKIRLAVAQAHPRHPRFFYLNIFAAFLEFSLENLKALFTWAFLLTHVYFKFSYIFSLLDHEIGLFYAAFFYLCSIPVLLYFSQQLRISLKNLNKELSYIFFAERFQDKFILLTTIFLYTTSILLPLRKAFLVYPANSSLPAVILAGYSLVIIFIIALFFNKEDVVKLIPTKHIFLLWLRRKIEKNYYPVFFFVIGLFILSNPYIGYSNLAWYLAFAASTTALLFNTLFLLHHYIREYAIFLFMREEDEDMQDKFEHAKAYYGFLVIFSFLFLLFITLLLTARIWGYTFTFTELWTILSKEWVIPIDVNASVGIVQFIILTIFIASGFVTSSFINKFILSKLFEVLRTEPGTQNTVSRIFHYVIVSIAIMLGFMAIKLAHFIFAVGTFLVVGIGFALKDVASDIFAGFIVLLERPIEIGNLVQVGEIEGTVKKIAARATTIVTARNATITISNKELLAHPIINWGQSRFAMGLEIFVRVEHGSDPELVKQLLITAAQNNPLVLRVPSVLVRLDQFEADALLFNLRPFISARRVPEYYIIGSNIRFEILALFKEHNIKLARPQRVIHGNINMAHQPEEYNNEQDAITIKKVV